MPDYATIRYDVAASGVATIALDQPETRNALSNDLLDDLLAALAAAEADDAVRLAVPWVAAFGTRNEQKLFEDGRARIRDVKQGPDGLLYVLTDESDGKLIRLRPD